MEDSINTFLLIAMVTTGYLTLYETSLFSGYDETGPATTPCIRFLKR